MARFMMAIVVACSENKVIGNKGKIPWKIPGEQARFKNLTIGNTVIMGRKSFEEIGHPLPGRFTIVVSRTKKISGDNCATVPSLNEALLLAKTQNNDIFIAGGEKIYQECIGLVDKIYLTLVHINVAGDRFFSDIDFDNWCCEKKEYINAKIPYTYLIYARKK